MRNAIFLHGKPTRERYDNPSEPKPHVANWFPWISKQLENIGVEVSVPALPMPYFPVYKDWRRVFEGQRIDEQTVLVGHSAGAEFILRWLSENSEQRTEQVVLVAPYHDFARKYGDFSEYTLDSDLVARTGSLAIINSIDDAEPIQRNVDRLMDALPGAKLVELDGFGHFRIGDTMTSEAFPQLLDILHQDC